MIIARRADEVMDYSSPVKLSIALPTRNRPDSLNLSLESLRAQSYQPFEVIVSDDSDPQYQPMVEKIAQDWQCQYIVGPRRGLYANRNNAALACSGSHIRTMDDDHRFPAEHLATCIEAVQSDPQSIWTTGETSFLNGDFYGTTAVANQLHPAGVGETACDLDNNWAIADGSTIYPATVFTSDHRMVEWYGYGPSYLEFGAYLYSRGFKSRCVRNAVIYHLVETATLHRLDTVEAMESQLFASLCFNLYFRPDRYLALKYIAARFRQAKFQLWFLKVLPITLQRAKARWAENGTERSRHPVGYLPGSSTKL